MVVEFHMLDLINFVSASMFVVRNFINTNFFGVDAKFRVPIIVTLFFVSPLIASDELQLPLSTLSQILWAIWIATLVLPAILQQQRFSRRRLQYFWIVNRIILDMKTGKSFRWSLKNSLNVFFHDELAWREEIERFVSFSQQFESGRWSLNSEDQLFLRCLRSSFQSSSHSLIILEAYRDHMSLIRNFRRRSRQVTVQIRAQMSVLIVMYVSSLVYFVKRNETFMNPIVYISSFMFFSGLILIYLLGRKVKWST